jgi:hypothetical protein
MKHKEPFIISIIFTATLLLMSTGCQQLDLKRIAAVNTVEVSGITNSSATAHGEIIDLGEEEVISDVGFCWAINRTPTLADNYIRLGSAASKGSYATLLNGLQSNTNYSVRAFVDDGEEVHYGNSVQFKTDFGMTTGEWIHYDDGLNADGIGLVEGGSFDIAIRFPAIDLMEYQGYTVSKIRFFPKTGDPVTYHMTLWEGSGNPTILFDEEIPNITVNAWTEYTPTFNYVIDGTTEVWFGIWVIGAPAGFYPAGCDNGPAVAGFGDMFSTDDGDTWDALSIIEPTLNYNWNLQVYVTNSKGKSVRLSREIKEVKRWPRGPYDVKTPARMASERENYMQPKHKNDE